MEQQHIRKTKKLRTFFIGYLAVFCLGILLLGTILFVCFTILLSNGVIRPANYSEIQLSANKGKIANSETVTPDLIPETCDYAVFTKNGEFLSGNMSTKDAAKAWKQTQTGGDSHSFIYYYLQIPRENEVYIVRYTLMAQFSSPGLRRYLPPPEVLLYLLLGFGFLSEVFLLATVFGRSLTRKMRGLQNATEKIQQQDLNFAVESSGISEIDNILCSMDKMKQALSQSLQKQWDLEQTRREQVAALAHDIKTPVTIVRGNVDLLFETDQTKEQKEYTAYIEESTRQMEQYVKTLIEISKADLGYLLNRQTIHSQSYIDNIHHQIIALIAFKKLKLNFEVHDLPESFSADPDLLQRAVLNIVSNAVDFSPENSVIEFSVMGKEERVQFCMIDHGKGFSKDDLEKAAQQFYMGDKSRTTKDHFGMGLFIANSIAEGHGGRLLIVNSPATGGGIVTIEISIEH